MMLHTESIADQTDDFADTFVHENIVHDYVVVALLWRPKVYS